jgi:phosphate transport system permease protein
MANTLTVAARARWRLEPHRVQDALFRGATQLFAVGVLVLLGAILVALAWGATPAFEEFGWHFLVTQHWDANTDVYGALPAIYGTLVTSAIAMLIAIPLGFGIAIFLTELCPPPLMRPIGTLIELLAAIPSIIYGIWGFFVLAPVMSAYIQPGLISTLGDLPVIGALFRGTPYGLGVLTAGIILAFMVLPFIASVTRDVFLTVPSMLRESAYGVGATTWEVVWHIVLPYTRTAIIGGVMLALGRALGETMAVTFVIGNANRLQASLLAPGTTISATLANQFAEAKGDMYVSALFALGLILFVISFIVLAAAKLMLAGLEQRAAK